MLKTESYSNGPLMARQCVILGSQKRKDRREIWETTCIAIHYESKSNTNSYADNSRVANRKPTTLKPDYKAERE